MLFAFVLVIAAQETATDDPVDVAPPPPAEPVDLVPDVAPLLPRRAVVPKPEPRVSDEDLRAVRGGACVGCLGGGLLSGGAATIAFFDLNSGARFGGCSQVCALAGVLGCGVCSSTGTVVGAGIAASSIGHDPFKLSPWLLSGVAIGVVALALPVAAFFLSATGVFFLPLELQGPLGVTFAVLLLAAGPISVAATFATGIEEHAAEEE